MAALFPSFRLDVNHDEHGGELARLLNISRVYQSLNPLEYFASEKIITILQFYLDDLDVFPTDFGKELSKRLREPARAGEDLKIEEALDVICGIGLVAIFVRSARGTRHRPGPGLLPGMICVASAVLVVRRRSVEHRVGLNLIDLIGNQLLG